MKQTSLIIQIIFFSVTFHLSAQDFFEGELNYKIEYEVLNKNISVSILEREMGDSFDAYVKEDKYIMTYNSKGELGWSKTIVLLDEGYTYVEYEKSDTIYKYPLDDNKSKLIQISRNVNDQKKVLDEMCESITLKYESTDSNSMFRVTDGKHYFNPKYKLNYKKYKNYTSGFWNLYVKESKAISIRNEHLYKGMFKSVSQATKITKKKIPEELFIINQDKIVKETD